MKKAILITNKFLNTDKFAEHYIWLEKAAADHEIKLSLWDNTEIMSGYDTGDDERLKERLRDVSFVIYWDKDILAGEKLSGICKEMNIPVYNSIESIRVCDNKAETYQKIWEWNNAHKNEKIPVIPTIVAPMTYPNIGYTSCDFIDNVIKKLGLPLIVKECYGSFGAQVYKAETYEEVVNLTTKLAGKQLIYQKYIKKSSGRDVRIQVVGERIVAAMYRYSTDGDFRANITNGGSMKCYTPSEAECNLALLTAKALGLDFAGIDLLFSGSGKNGADEADIVCEVNSNAHFKNIHTCTGINVAEKIIEYILSQL
ncbi:MAG: RimK family alpha-L-glutamate ligase [Lachnospiraceae bacterium]|nr:RimK family alpha-L-glutamate ligase [Lachnospiraceae bacterium]